MKKVKIKISSDETLEIETFQLKKAQTLRKKLNEIEKPKEKLEYIISLLDQRALVRDLSDKISGDTLLEVFLWLVVQIKK